jgi:hypothetical protein
VQRSALSKTMVTVNKDLDMICHKQETRQVATVVVIFDRVVA